MRKKIQWEILIAGGMVGLAAVLLSLLGNPANMGFCIACFERDIAGAIGLHAAEKVQYLRPEIPGIVLGAFCTALIGGEFRPRAGSSPVVRLILGMIVMIGALSFLGCPLRMVLRLGGGDLNALVALCGFIPGIAIGVLFLNKGFSLQRAHPSSQIEGSVFPVVMLVLALFAMVFPYAFHSSETGPGSMHAPMLISFGIALITGAVAQKARLCLVGGFRDLFLFRDGHLLYGFGAILGIVFIGNMILGKFHLSFSAQPIAHSEHIWNFLGMFLVGWGSVLLGGCPLRQLILTGEGNSDSAITVIGMLFGAAISHNFTFAGAAASDGNPGGLQMQGKIAIVSCIVILLVISFVNTYNMKEKRKKENKHD